MQIWESNDGQLRVTCNHVILWVQFPEVRVDANILQQNIYLIASNDCPPKEKNRGIEASTFPFFLTLSNPKKPQNLKCSARPFPFSSNVTLTNLLIFSGWKKKDIKPVASKWILAHIIIQVIMYNVEGLWNYKMSKMDKESAEMSPFTHCYN